MCPCVYPPFQITAPGGPHAKILEPPLQL